MSRQYQSLLAAFSIFLAIAPLGPIQAQPPQQGNPPGGQGPFQAINQPNVEAGQSNSSLPGLQGGAAQADFDSLIDLIQSTVAFDSWADNGTGEGQIDPFAVNGVFVDATGALRFSPRHLTKTSLEKVVHSPAKKSINNNSRQPSPLRFVSLSRLEAAIADHQQQSKPLSVEMLTLAGLQRVQYVIAYPDSGDLVFAGPAGDWQIQPNDKILSADTGQPVVRLDDLLTLWRRQLSHSAAAFGCSITPRQQALSQTQDFLRKSGSRPLEPSHRKEWLHDLRNSLGRQDVEFFGIAADSHVAKTLLLADYHMKLLGMGLADGVQGLESYLDTVRLLPNGQAPPMSVLRWWFALNYEPIETSPNHNVFHIRGQAVQVLSENELLSARGQRIHTGQSDELNQRFATSFTEQFNQICQRYPLYGELRNVFDLAFAIALIKHENLTEKAGWHPTLFANDEKLPLPTTKVPQEVETVINHRILNGQYVIAGVSGGVWVHAHNSLRVKTAGKTSNLDIPSLLPTAPSKNSTQPWWWDE